VELNRAVAVAMCEEPEKGLGLIDDLLERGELANYHLAHSARAELCRRLGRIPEARTSYEKALSLVRRQPDYRPEQVFAFRQSLAGFRYYQGLVAEADGEIQRNLAGLETATTAKEKLPERTKKSHYQRRRYEPKSFDLRGELYRIFGVDLTNVPGISAITAHTILCEIGTDVSQFRNASAFASWLGLCPERKISRGQFALRKIAAALARFSLRVPALCRFRP
jgi:transposase